MAKEIETFIKLQVKGGQANPAPPVGPALGSKGVNIMEFCKRFNAQTQDKQGKILPVVLTVFKDKSFDRVIMVDALHHVKDYRITIHELWRVLMPGGRIVIEEPDIQTFPVKLMALVEKIALMRSHFISSGVISSGRVSMTSPTLRCAVFSL